MRYTRSFFLNSRNCTRARWKQKKRKRGTQLLLPASSLHQRDHRPLPLSSSHLNGFEASSNAANLQVSLVQNSLEFSRKETNKSVIGNGKFSWNISSPPSKFFPPLYLLSRPRFFKKEKIAGRAGRVVGDDLDISIPETCRLVEIYFNEHEGPLCFSSSSRQEKEIRSSLVLNVFKRSRVFTGFSCWPGGIP